jgi:tetratricopeptide (TPR) repeat protein
VPEELQAAVLMPAKTPPPLPALPVDQTPAIAVAALDVPVVAKRPRPRFRTGLAVAVAAVGVATGLGVTLLIGHGSREAPATVSPRPAPPRAASPARAEARPKAEAAAKPAATPKAAAEDAPSAPASKAAHEPSDVPVSSAAVPSCQEILGRGFVRESNPKGALAETQLANRELVRGNAHASQLAFCKAAAWDSGKIERWLNLAQIFLVRRDDKQALGAAERALELDAKNARALEMVGDAEARLGHLEEARKAYLDSEHRPEPGADALRWLVKRDMDEAQRSLRSRDFVRAERLYRRVVVFDPNHAGAALGVSTCLRKLDDQKTADAWEKRAGMLARRAAGKGT